jgi:hypothetical protein
MKCAVNTELKLFVTRRKLFFFYRITGMVVDCVIDCNDKVSYTDENCALVGYYTVSSGNVLSMFRDDLSAPSSGVNP